MHTLKAFMSMQRPYIYTISDDNDDVDDDEFDIILKSPLNFYK